MQSRRGFGAVRRLPSGRYQASVTAPDGTRHNAPTTFTTKLAAEQWLTAQRRELEAGTWSSAPTVAPAPAVSVVDYARSWLTMRELKPRTRVEYGRLIEATIAGSALGGLSVDAVTRQHVAAWWHLLNPDTPTRRAHSYALLRTILNSAVDEELLTVNPCRIKGAGTTKRVRPINTTTDEELEIIVEHTPERYRAMILLAGWCALRFGEVIALRRDDVDLTKGTLRVGRAAVRVEGEYLLGDPKSSAGLRTIAIPPHLIPVVKAHLSTYVTGRQGLLFPAPEGGILSRGNAISRWWHPAREAAGRPDLRFHDLRHTGATRAGIAGATIAELQHRLGHSTAAAAMRYQHSTAERDSAIAARMSQLSS